MNLPLNPPNKLIDAIETRTGQSMDYLRQLREDSPGALWKFLWFLPLSGHGSVNELQLLTVARIAASRHEDCGACLQIVVDDALRRGVNRSIVLDAAGGASEELPETERLVFRFAEAVARVDPEADELRARLMEKIPRATLSELAVAIATARVFPAMKRAMGHSTSCSPVQLS